MKSNSIFTAQFWVDSWHDLTRNAVHSLLEIIGILFAYLLLRYLAYGLIDGILARVLARESHLTGVSEERTGRVQTLQGVCKSVVGYVLFFVFGILFLKAVGFDILPFITTASVIGLAIGIGAQKLVKDVISGFFIIIDNLFVVGDTITIGAVTGQVQEMGMRVTRVLDAAGRLHQFANGDIGLVSNLSRHPVEDFIEINLAATADLNKVVQTIQATGESLFKQEDHHLQAQPRMLGITAFTAASVTVRASVVSDPRYLLEEQMRVRAALREALLAAEIPLA